ncbi:MAG TPA: hypothetical protein VM054_09100 [bacterium]|nr:hypothetical protein [bacterium]
MFELPLTQNIASQLMYFIAARLCSGCDFSTLDKEAGVKPGTFKTIWLEEPKDDEAQKIFQALFEREESLYKPDEPRLANCIESMTLKGYSIRQTMGFEGIASDGIDPWLNSSLRNQQIHKRSF